MENLETFHPVPLAIDPASKAISTSDPALAADIEELNKLHRGLLALETPNQIPAPPAPVNPKRSVMLGKLRDSGNAAYRKGAFAEALKLYDLALRMATDRPSWEAAGLVREELAALYNNRSQANIALQLWADAACDAEIAVEMKRVGNVQGWVRRGKCLMEMGRLDDAVEWVQSGLDFERAGPEKQAIGELESLARELKGKTQKA